MKKALSMAMVLATIIPSITSAQSTNNVNIAVTGSIVPKSCSVDTENIDIDMGTVSVRDLTAVGVGASIRPTGQGTIVLTCPSPILTMTMTMQDASDLASSLPYVKLSGSGSAQGVGIQMFDSDNRPIPLGPGSSWVAGSDIAAGKFTVPIIAAYYRTTAAVTAGTGNAGAIFNVSYK
jgi:major type 1 subunit fimbrin (pilin)